jgi:hypothetical protein
MHIQVVSAEGGRHELITVTEPVTILRGEKLNRLICGATEHWFKKDGTYDGWGMNLQGTDLSPEEISKLVDEVDRNRVFP